MNTPYIPQSLGLEFGVQGLTQTAINEPLPLNRDDHRDPDLRTLKGGRGLDLGFQPGSKPDSQVPRPF